MKETKKAVPFLVAISLAIILFHTNPTKESHFGKIKAEYVETNLITWRATWWNYERSLSHQDYLFFSVVKRKHRPKTIGVLGFVIVLSEA